MNKVKVHVPGWEFGVQVDHGEIYKFEEFQHDNLLGIAEQICMTQAIWAVKP